MVSAHFPRCVSVYLLHMRRFHVLVLVAFYRFLLVNFHHQMLIVAHPCPRIVLHAMVHIALSVEKDLFLALLVLKAKFVEVGASTFLGTARDNAAAGIDR